MQVASRSDELHRAVQSDREADADPAGLRGPAAPGGPSEDGRKAGRTLSADGDALLAKARPANQP